MAKSPIESLLFNALIRVCTDAGLGVTDYVTTGVPMQIGRLGRGPLLCGRPTPSEVQDAQWDYEFHETHGDIKQIGDVSIAGDVHVHGYRVDLALSLSLESDLGHHTMAPFNSLVLVECDGHDWHERTPQQAARDRSRDREILLKAGVPVIRFTGSEIVRDPDGCAKEVVDIAISTWNDTVSMFKSVALYAVGSAAHDSRENKGAC